MSKSRSALWALDYALTQCAGPRGLLLPAAAVGPHISVIREVKRAATPEPVRSTTKHEEEQEDACFLSGSGIIFGSGPSSSTVRPGNSGASPPLFPRSLQGPQSTPPRTTSRALTERRPLTACLTDLTKGAASRESTRATTPPRTSRRLGEFREGHLSPLLPRGGAWGGLAAGGLVGGIAPLSLGGGPGTSHMSSQSGWGSGGGGVTPPLPPAGVDSLAGGLVEPPELSGELEIEVEARLLFENVWKRVEGKLGNDHLYVPKEIVWLNGAPGAGKGANTPFILKTRGFESAPVQMSDLLSSSPEAASIMKSGGLVHDATVVELLLEAILKTGYEAAERQRAQEGEGEASRVIPGVVVDGFPRTTEQVDFVKLLYDKLMVLHYKYMNTDMEWRFPRPIFRIAVLYVEEEESVARQLARGRAAIIHNERVRDSGIGELREVRPTDLSESSARRRYQVFRAHYNTLLRLKAFFPFHLIDAMGSLNDCRDQIGEELQYQSALELEETTFRVISHIPLAKDVARTARQAMVARLDHYEKHDRDTFVAVVDVIDHEFVPAIRRGAVAGRAVVHSANPLFFEKPVAAEILADILSERGYYVTWQVEQREVPVRLQRATMMIETETLREMVFRVAFDRPLIRASDHEHHESEMPRGLTLSSLGSLAIAPPPPSPSATMTSGPER